MNPTFTIHGPWPSFNEYIEAERRNRFLGAKMKKEEMERICWQLPAERFNRINLTFQPYFKDRKKDPDSIMFFVKCFLDAMVAKGLIENDGQRQIARIVFEPVQVGEERMIVTITQDAPSPLQISP